MTTDILACAQEALGARTAGVLAECEGIIDERTKEFLNYAIETLRNLTTPELFGQLTIDPPVWGSEKRGRLSIARGIADYSNCAQTVEWFKDEPYAINPLPTDHSAWTVDLCKWATKVWSTVRGPSGKVVCTLVGSGHVKWGTCWTFVHIELITVSRRGKKRPITDLLSHVVSLYSPSPRKTLWRRQPHALTSKPSVDNAANDMTIADLEWRARTIREGVRQLGLVYGCRSKAEEVLGVAEQQLAEYRVCGTVTGDRGMHELRKVLAELLPDCIRDYTACAEDDAEARDRIFTEQMAGLTEILNLTGVAHGALDRMEFMRRFIASKVPSNGGKLALEGAASQTRST